MKKYTLVLATFLSFFLFSCSSSNIEKIVLCKNLNGISIDHEINTKEGYIKEIRSNENFLYDSKKNGNYYFESSKDVRGKIYDPNKNTIVITVNGMIVNTLNCKDK